MTDICLKQIADQLLDRQDFLVRIPCSKAYAKAQCMFYAESFVCENGRTLLGSIFATVKTHRHFDDVGATEFHRITDGWGCGGKKMHPQSHIDWIASQVIQDQEFEENCWKQYAAAANLSPVHFNTSPRIINFYGSVLNFEKAYFKNGCPN